MTQHSPIELSVEALNDVELSAEALHNITLSVSEYFYTQMLYAILANASCAFEVKMVCKVVSKVNALCNVAFSAQASPKTASKLKGSAESIIVAQTALKTLSKLNGSADIPLIASVQTKTKSIILPAADISIKAELAAVAKAIITGQATVSFGASAQVSAGGTPLLLDTLNSTVLSAASFRKLRAGYTGYICRIRRSDGVIADVLFYNGAISMDSTISVVSGSTNASILGDFVYASGYADVDSLDSGATAYLSDLYNQAVSGSTYDLSQSTEASQPPLIVAGALLLKTACLL